MCVECLFLRTPGPATQCRGPTSESQSLTRSLRELLVAPRWGKSACAKRAAYPDPRGVSRSRWYIVLSESVTISHHDRGSKSLSLRNLKPACDHDRLWTQARSDVLHGVVSRKTSSSSQAPTTSSSTPSPTTTSTTLAPTTSSTTPGPTTRYGTGPSQCSHRCHEFILQVAH